MKLRERMHWRKLASVSKDGVVSRHAAELLANARVVPVKQRAAGNVNSLQLTEETWERRQIATRAQGQRPYLTLQGTGVIGKAACAFVVHPFGVAEVGRQDEYNTRTFINCSFQGFDPVIAPSNGLDIEEALHAVAR